MMALSARAACVAVLMLAASSAMAGTAESPPALLAAGLWPDSALSRWRTPTAGGVRSEQRIPGVEGAGSFAGGMRQAAGRSVFAGRAEGRLLLPITSRLAAEVVGGVIALDSGPAFDRRITRTETRLRLGGPSRNVWVGGAFERDLSGGRLPEGALLALGAASRISTIAIAASLEQTAERVRVTSVVVTPPPIDTLSPTVTTMTDMRFSTATNARLSARWGQGRLAVETVAGLTLNRLAPPRRWSQSSASLALMPHLSLFATVGNAAPRWLALDAGFERRATLGMRLTSRIDPAAVRGEADETTGLPKWRLRHLGQDWYVIEIRAPRVQTVSVMGDFTEWASLALRHLSGDRWAVATRLAPGVHQVQVRLDGGTWLPPAGLAATADGFDGSAGVFVAE